MNAQEKLVFLFLMETLLLPKSQLEVVDFQTALIGNKRIILYS